MKIFALQDVQLRSLSLHWTGNKFNNEPLILTDCCQTIEDPELKKKITHFLLGNFRDETIYHFTDPSASLSELATTIFQDPGSFHENSKIIAHHLYDASDHHWIHPGECWVVYFKNLIMEDHRTDALGIFKSELKEEFIYVERNKNSLVFSLKEGINMKRIDKGCLIVNQPETGGYRVLITDNISHKDPADYWKEKFLGIKVYYNAYASTKNELRILRAFLDQEKDQPEKIGQIGILDNSINFLSENESFNLRHFQEKVFPEKTTARSYENFRNQYRNNYDVEIEDEYDIDHRLLKNPKKYLRSVIKLDKDFHIYIHGNRQHIVKGYDETKGMNYYTIYYHEES